MLSYSVDTSRAVVLVSGGIDSSVLLAKSKQGREPLPLLVDYGQTHKEELDCARWQCGQLDYVFVSVGGLSIEPLGLHSRFSAAFSPARNTVLLSLALALCDAERINEIWFGANLGDQEGFPDCRPEYFTAFERMSVLGTNIGGVEIVRPFVQMSKAGIISLGKELGVDFSHTRSCYGSGAACGTCEACRKRASAFREAGLDDPCIS